MSEGTKNVTLYQQIDQGGNPVTPLVPECAVYDENGTRLGDKLKGINLKVVSDTISDGIKAIKKEGSDQVSEVQQQLPTLKHQIGLDKYNEFNSSTNYIVGDVVMKDDHIYRYKVAHMAGAWNPQEVEEVDIQDIVRDPLDQKIKEINPILENGKYNNIIVGIQSNFVADEFKLTQLYNRETSSDSIASQIITIRFKINDVIKACRYISYKNHISYDNEVVKLEETTGSGQYLLVWVRWGGIILNEAVSIPINKFSITYPQEFQLSTFSKNVVEDNIEIVGIYTNFDFKELHLIRFYNRNTNSTSIASQIIEFSGILNDNTPISIEKVEYNNTIHRGLHSYILKYQSYEVGVLVNWKYNHEDAHNKRVFKECINIISSSNSSDNNINGYIDNCYLIPSNDDIIKSNGTFVIDKEGNLIGNRLSTDDIKYVLFNPDIRAIEFDIANLWDSNLIHLAFGYGNDSDSTECACVCYMPTNLRPNDIGFLINANSSDSQSASIYGFGHYSGDYRQPQISPTPVKVNSHCRIELSEKGFFEGKIQDEVSKDWKFWFCLDTNGIWAIPNRFGWNLQKCIGFAVRFSVFSNLKILSNIKIINKKNTYLEKII